VKQLQLIVHLVEMMEIVKAVIVPMIFVTLLVVNTAWKLVATVMVGKMATLVLVVLTVQAMFA